MTRVIVTAVSIALAAYVLIVAIETIATGG